MVDDISLMLHAFKFVALKHQHQRRKSEIAVPYINHLIEVSETLWEIGQVRDIDTIVAGILHDTIEDTDTSPEELESTFSKKIRTIVEEVSDDKNLPKQERKRLQIAHAGDASLEARQIKLADKICNVRDLATAPPANWSLERRIAYVDWAEKVVNGLRGSSERLEQYFDKVARITRKSLEQEAVEEE
jgi:guanosine-3',5'-bis(diphosphate) 3'-pyrophosphohydrolase